MNRNKNWWPPVFSLLLTAYALFTLLDAFVLPRDVVVMCEAPEISAPESEPTAEPVELSCDDPGDMSEENSIENQEPSPPEITEVSYKSDGISITLTTLTRYDTQVYVADVVLEDASCLRTGLANGSFGRNISEFTSAIAEENGAILAINGDYYGFRDQGFVLRNGQLYRDAAQSKAEQEDLVIYADGHFEIVREAESDASALNEAGAEQIFSFGPGLIIDSEISVSEGSEVGQSMQSNPRTAIGEIEPLHYALVVSDGRREESAGLSLLELAEVMEELGCHTAYNMDGGGSSTMWFMGRIVNNPTDGWSDGERRVSDIVYIWE